MIVIGLLSAVACRSETRFYVNQRTDYEKGKTFGNAGVYEFIDAKVVTGAGQGRADVLKPRDPATGNGTFVLIVNGSGKLQAPESTLNSGVTIVRLMWPDTKSLESGVSEVVSFLRYDGGPMLLGDQKRFLKRAIVLDDQPWVSAFLRSGKNADPKGRPLLDASLPKAEATTMDLSKAQPLSK